MPFWKHRSSPSIAQHSNVSNVSDIYYSEAKKRKLSRSLKRLLRNSVSLNAFYEQLIAEGIDPAGIEQGRTWGNPTEYFEGPGFWSRLFRWERPNRYELDSLFVAPVARYPAYREQYSPEKRITFHGITELPEETQQQRILSAMLKLSQNGEGVKPEGGDQHYLETVWLVAQEVGIACTYQPDADRQRELLSTWTPSKAILEAKRSRRPTTTPAPESLKQATENTEPQLTPEVPSSEPEALSAPEQGERTKPIFTSAPLDPPESQVEKPKDEPHVKDEAAPPSSQAVPQPSVPLTPVTPDTAAQLPEINKNLVAVEKAIRDLITRIDANQQPVHSNERAGSPQAQSPISEVAAPPASPAQEIVDNNIPLPTVVKKEFEPYVAAYFENIETAAHQPVASDAPITTPVEKPAPAAPVAPPVETALPQNHAESFGLTEPVVQKSDVEATGVVPPVVASAVTAEATGPVALALKEPTAIVSNRRSSEAIERITEKPNAIVRDPVASKALAIKPDETLAPRPRNETLAIVEQPEVPAAQTFPPVVEAVDEQVVRPLPVEKPFEQEPTPIAGSAVGLEEPTAPSTIANETGEQVESEPKSLAKQRRENFKKGFYGLRDSARKRAALMQSRNAGASDQTTPVENAQTPTPTNLIDNAETATVAKQAPVEQQAVAVEIPVAIESAGVPKIVEPLTSDRPELPKEEPKEDSRQLGPTIQQTPAEPAVAEIPQTIESAVASQIAAGLQGSAVKSAVEAFALVGRNLAAKRLPRLRNLSGRYGLLKKDPVTPRPLSERDLSETMERARFLEAMPTGLVDEIFGPATNNDGQCRKALSKYDVFALDTLNRSGRVISSYMVTPNNWFTSPFRIELDSTDPRLEDVRAHAAVTKKKVDAVFGIASPLNERAYYATPKDWDSLVALSKKSTDAENEGGEKLEHPSDTSLPSVDALGAFFEKIGKSNPMKKRAVDKMFGDPDDDKCAEVLASRNVYFVTSRRDSQTMISTFAVVEGDDLANALRIDVDEYDEPKRHDHLYIASAKTRTTYLKQDDIDIRQFVLEGRGPHGDLEALIDRSERLLVGCRSPSPG